jgi:NhaA family Na+:H+ antiporter
MRRPTLAYLRTESGAGLIIVIAALAALAIANSRLAGPYFALLASPVRFQIGGFVETLSLAAWARSVLMPVFFLTLGMQLKFEVLRGALSSQRRQGLAALAALGGLVGPALAYLALSHGPASGWSSGLGVGLATDGSLALAILAVAAPRLSGSLRVLMMSVALIDNVVADLFAAVLSPGRLNPEMLLGAGAVLAGLALLSRWRRAPFLFYAAGFIAVWGFAMKSGLDASLAALASAFTVPVGARRPGQQSTLKYFMDSLHPYVAFAVLPLFVLATAGIAARHVSPADLAAPVPLAILAALAIGKPVGVFGFCAAGIGLRLVRRPMGARWSEIGAVSILTGVSVAVGSFVAGVDTGTPAAETAVLLASALTALVGGSLLAWTQQGRPDETVDLA